MAIRKIESKEESDRKRKRNTLIISVIMISVLVFGTAGYFSGRETSTEGNQSVVSEMGNEWVMQYGSDNQILRFSNSPESVKNVSIMGAVALESYYGQTVYVSSDNDALTYEIASNLGRYTERMQPACYGNCSKDLPSKNCTDILIVFNASEQSRVYQKENCLFIEGDMRAADAFLYRIFGVN